MTSGTTQRATNQKPEPEPEPGASGTKLEGLQYKVFKDRYALKGEDGTPLEEYPEQMWRRVAGGIAGVEPTPKKRAEWTEKFYELLRDFKFVPGGRILSGAGTPHLVTYYNCYVVGLGEDPLNPDAPKKPQLDSAVARPAFFTALSQMTDIMSRSGGVGINLSALPPKGTSVAAPGRGQRGAVRPTVALGIGHPDIQRFVAERDSASLANVDLAVIVSPEFDQALAEDAEWTPQWETWRGETVKARELWARVNADGGRRMAIIRPGAATLTLADSREAIVEGAGQTSLALFHGESPVIDFSPLRPKGAYIKTVNGTSSGPVAWMYLFDAVARSDDGASAEEKGVIWYGEIASVITGKTIQQGGCFGPDQRIATTRGLLRASDLADLLDVGTAVEALTHQGPRPVTYVFRNGTKPLFRVTTARGFTVDVTGEHKMGVLRGGRLATMPLAELAVGDEILQLLGEKVAGDYVTLRSSDYQRSVMSTRLNEEVRLPEALDERLAYFLGYLHGDGYVHWGHKVTWRAPKAIKLATADAHPAIREYLVASSRELFGIEPIIEDRSTEACASVALYSRVLIDWLEVNGLLKAHSESVRVPEAIFRSPSSVMGAFIAGYFDADGCDRGRKGGYGFDSVSLDMLHDVQQLLAANGILSHIYTTDRSAQGWQTIHRLIVSGAEFRARMSQFISMAHKNRAHEGLRNHFNRYSRDVWAELGVPGRYYQGLWDSTKPHISYRELSRVQDRLVTKGEVALAERVEQILHTVPDRITAIEPLGPSEVYDFEVAEVHMLSGNGIYTSNSRRGALMLMLDDDHPDVEEFIAAKRIDPITNRPVMIEHANMSLCVSDAFMAAVKADLPWDLKWQGKVVRTVRARDIWDRITEAAWRTAEPGVVFMQRAREQSPMWFKENIRCTNPCVTGETLVYTAAGLYPAAELAEMGSNIVVTSVGSGEVSFEQATHVWASGVKPVYRLRTREGYSLRLTADHRVMTTRGWVEAGELNSGDEIRLLNGEGGFGSVGDERLGRVLGWLVGDGHINNNRANGQPAVVLGFWGQDRALAPEFAEAVNQLVAAPEGARIYPVSVADIAGRDESRITSMRLIRLLDPELLQHKLQVPPSVLRGTRGMQRGFLQALFSADGSVQGSQAKGVSVRLASSDVGLLEGTQRLLLNFGIASCIYANRRLETMRMMPDGKGVQHLDPSQPQHELVIARANLAPFAEWIGFLQVEKQRKLTDLLHMYKRALNSEAFTATFESLTPDGEEMVYDLTEPVHHSFIANGLYVSNCGEQAIPAGAVCNLGAINLVAFVDDDGKLNEGELALAAAHATRFLDDVIDATPYFSELHVKMQREGTRRIGLGTMGLADALIKMRVAYGSAESLEVIDRIYGTIRDAAYRESIELAQEKAPCGFFERDPYLEGPFIQRLPDDIREGIRRHGVRNGVLLTQAPTGTTSLLAGVSSGVEPVFDFAIKRVDRIGEHIIYHPLYQAWLAEHPDEERPGYFVATRDLTPEQHVTVQARVQQYTDSSISKTVNGPHEHTIEDVKQLYTLAYDLGCKGVTYYRDGSRDAVLSAVPEQPKAATDKQEKAGETAAMNGTANHVDVPATPAAAVESPPVAATAPAAAPASHARDKRYRNGMKVRPAVVQGYTRQVRAPEGKVNVTLNSDEDGVLEVFVNVGKAGSDVAALAEALGRMISIHLQIDSPLSQSARAKEIAHQLRSIGGSGSIGFGMDRVRSLPDAVARALELHLAGITNGGTLPAPDLPGGAAGEATPNHTADHAADHAGGGASNGHAPRSSGHAGGVNPGTTALYAVTGNLCPECGCNTLVNEEGCKKCYTCGHSEC